MNRSDEKAAIRDVLVRLADAAEAAGLGSTARDIRTARLPKLDEERFTLVVLGEFNRGKSTFINALLGGPVLPVGVTPTTAVLTHIQHGEPLRALAVLESGERRPVDARHLDAWLTVEGKSPEAAALAVAISHLEISHPAPLLRDHLTIVDTPGVNDLNEQRADITYGYLPRADAAVFLLDATQILSASERQFLEERILRSCRDRLVFVITKADLLDAGELEEALRFARRHLAAIVPEPAIFPVSAKRALAGDQVGSMMAPLLDHLRLTVGRDRRRLLYDHALADAGRVSAFVRQSLAIRRRTLELSVDDLSARVARAEERLKNGRRALDEAAETIHIETAALKARVREDLAAFAGELQGVLPAEIDAAAAPDVQRYLGPFLQDRWKDWIEAEGAVMAAALERLAEQVIQVANENALATTLGVARDLAAEDPRLTIKVDTFKYDASVFALGALGTTILLFVNTLAGGLLTLAAPILAVILRGRVAHEIKAEAGVRAPESVRRVAALLGPKLDEIVDGFAQRLGDFVAEAGASLARGIAEVLARALEDRRRGEWARTASPEGAAIDEALRAWKAIDERIADIRQAVWDEPGP